MSDSGVAFFYANKQNRNAAFHFANHMNENSTLDAETHGDQSARLFPTPAVLGSDNDQKLTAQTTQEPAAQLTPIETPRLTTHQPAVNALGTKDSHQ